MQNLILFDLDETLVHALTTESTVPPQLNARVLRVQAYWVYVRPYAVELLLQV